MLGKGKAKTYDIFVIGEQIRCQMKRVNLIKDRRYHLRKYRNCFVGRDAVDWLVKMHHTQTRSEAVLAMRCLQEHGVLHHVVDDHVFKDQNLFYRFCRDDDTYRLNTELVIFFQGLEVFERLKEAGARREFYHKGHLYQDAFYGCQLVDCLQNDDEGKDRSSVINQCRELLEYDIIGHVTDDYHFRDDRLMYQFRVDYDRPCLLSDLLQPYTDPISRLRTTDTSPLSTGAVEPAPETASESGSVGRSSVLTASSVNSECLDNDTASNSSYDNNSRNNDPGVRSRSSRDVQKSWLTTSKREVKLEQDHVGYGFVLRGTAPCYVHTVDPWGPAAAAGLKVGQFVISVNGQSVKGQDHRSVGRLVMEHTGRLSLTVTTTSVIRD